MNVVSVLPPKLEKRLADFLAAEGTGCFELNIKDGAVLTWTVKESGKG